MNLSDKQREFVESDAKRCVFMGGRYSGKTTALITKANTYARQYGRDNCLIVAPSSRLANAIRKFDPRPNCDVISTNTNSHAEKIRVRNRIQAVDHVFIDEYTHIPQEDKAFITESDAKSISAAMTPNSSTSWLRIKLEQLQAWETIVAPSHTNPTSESNGVNKSVVNTAGINGHDIIESDEMLYCLSCGESIEMDADCPIETLYTYGKFHNIDCEQWVETFK